MLKKIKKYLPGKSSGALPTTQKVTEPVISTEEYLSKLSKPFYEVRAAALQNSIDLFKGTWKTSFSDLAAGKHNMLENDSRPAWVENKLPNGLTGKSIIELGPFEAYQTYLLEEKGGSVIASVEANSYNFLKCLIIKNALGLNAQYLLGDCVDYLESFFPRQCDLVWASGILYHQVDPLRFLKAVSRVTNSVFIWTHFYDEDAMQRLEGEEKLKFQSQHNQVRTIDGVKYEYFYRSYLIEDYSKNIPGYWEGGNKDYAFWLKLSDIRSFLHQNGFVHQIADEVELLNGLPMVQMVVWK